MQLQGEGCAPCQVVVCVAPAPHQHADARLQQDRADPPRQSSGHACAAVLPCGMWLLLQSGWRGRLNACAVHLASHRDLQTSRDPEKCVAVSQSHAKLFETDSSWTLRQRNTEVPHSSRQLRLQPPDWIVLHRREACCQQAAGACYSCCYESRCADLCMGRARLMPCLHGVLRDAEGLPGLQEADLLGERAPVLL